MELACDTMSTGSKRTSAANQPASKWAKTVDSRMASQMGHFKPAGSPKRKNFTPRRRLALQYMDSSASGGKLFAFVPLLLLIGVIMCIIYTHYLYRCHSI